MWQVGRCHLLCNANHMVTRSVCSLKCSSMFFPKGLAFVERLEFAGQQSLDLPAPPPKQDLFDWRDARKAWEDGGRKGFIEVRTDFSEASHGLRDGPPPSDLHLAQPHNNLPGFSSDSVVASLMAFKPRTAS